MRPDYADVRSALAESHPDSYLHFWFCCFKEVCSVDRLRDPGDDLQASLRALEREVAPLAEEVCSRTLTPTWHSKALRLGLPAAALTAALIGAVLTLWPPLRSALWHAENRTVALGKSSHYDDIMRLRQALNASEAAHHEVLEELETTRQEVMRLQEASKPRPWYADTQALTYRDPWAK